MRVFASAKNRSIHRNIRHCIIPETEIKNAHYDVLGGKQTTGFTSPTVKERTRKNELSIYVSRKTQLLKFKLGHFSVLTDFLVKFHI
jgi:hypothetical protein